MTTVPPSEESWLAEAVRLATESVAEGGGPFGAVIVRAGEVIATGTNAVTRSLDPTAHAEVVAIRAACRALGTFELTGCRLYASCEPCPMCAFSSLWARLDQVVYAADRDMAAAAGFDDRAFYELFDQEPASWPMAVVRIPLDPVALAAADAPFAAWREHTGRTHY